MTTVELNRRACTVKRRRTRALAVVAATAATFAIWSFTEPVSVAGTGPVTLAAVVAVTVLAGLAAWASLATLERFFRRGRTVWVGLAVAVLLLSLLGPIGSAVGAGATVALVAMHLVTGAILIPIMGRG